MLENLLNKRFYTLYTIPFLLGSLTIFSFQPFNFSFINFFILPSFFYLIIFIKKKSKSTYRKKPFKKNLFIFSTAFGFGYYLSGIHWINYSLTFDESFKIFIPFGLILIPLFLSLFFSSIILIIAPYLNYNLRSILFFSGGLAFSDFIRAKILTGFPWNLWSYSLSWSVEIIQSLNLIGFFAFNLIAITIFTLPSFLYFNYNISRKLLLILTLTLFIISIFIFGSHSINKNKIFLQNFESKFNIKVISPNFSLKYGLNENEIEERLKKLIKYSEPDKNTKTLFIWPEGVFSGYRFDEIKKFQGYFLKNFGKNHHIIFGVNKLDKNKIGVYNSLVIVNNRLEIVKKYNKQKLVPFGEFLPFEKVLNKIGFKKITEGHGSFLKGDKQNNLVVKELNILPLICYEIIFTKFIQDSEKNTNLIVNISEDGWFGKSVGPHQHFSKAIFRSVEQNSFLIRSTNKGISAIINNKGEIIKKLDVNEAGNIEFDVPLVENKNKNKNDLIFFILLITYILIFKFNKNNNVK